MFRFKLLLVLAFGTSLVAVEARAQVATTVDIGGVVQPRYEYTLQDNIENLSSFYLRRVRLDVQGRVLLPELTYRVMPELARTANLRDAWLNYAFSPAAELRVGQFSVPFQWHRHISARAHHFAERGVPSETFGFPDGRDIGVMLHGRNAAATLRYAIGVFDGSGRNTLLSNSDGHMASARVTWAALGPLPSEESDLSRRTEPGLSLGVGIQGANKNEARPWDIGRSPTGNNRADYVAGAADVSLRWMGLSLTADGYLRHVDPDDPTVDQYSGWGYMVSSGYFILPQRLELVARYSNLRLDSEAIDTQAGELGLGLTLYHRGHNLKTRINFLSGSGERPARYFRDGAFLIDLYAQF